ncbi:MAG: hypothetical protein AAGL10_15190 [Pseudomonadota bacterium]
MGLLPDAAKLGGYVGRASAKVRTFANALAMVSDAQFLALEDQTKGLAFDLHRLDESMSGWIAASMALGGQIVVPDRAVSFSLNASTYPREQGFAGSVSAQVADKVYIAAGIAGSTARDSTGGRVGVTFSC